jgi:hypothetical protein
MSSSIKYWVIRSTAKDIPSWRITESLGRLPGYYGKHEDYSKTRRLFSSVKNVHKHEEYSYF